MPKVVLLPDWNVAPGWSEVIGKVFDPDKPLPQQWQPKIEEASQVEQVEAFAFPTPFAWAEVTSAVIRQDRFNHLLFRLYSDLVLGLVLGHVQLEIIDLKSAEFGRVLAGTDERYRYFGLLRGSSNNRELKGKVFGATSPETLVWPSPRRTGDEWQELKTAINKDGRQKDAYTVLADFRELLNKQRLWNPGNEVPWMKGLDHIIGERKASESNRHYHVHSRSVGPVLTALPKNELHPLYFPVYEERFASDLLEALTSSFEQGTDHISVLDDKGRKHYEILMPAVPADGDSLLAGAGTVRAVSEPGKIRDFGSSRIRLEDDENGRGLFFLLQPLDEALRHKQALYNPPGVEVEAVKATPFFFPDITRIAVSRLGEAGLRDTGVSLSDQAYELAFSPEGPGLPLISELTDLARMSLGFVLQYTHEGKTKRALYIEEYGGYNIGDLKALGWVLWSFFIGAAELSANQIRDQEGGPLLKEHLSGRPLSLDEHAYKKVIEERDRHRRLATLQRFVRAYSELASAQDATSIDKLSWVAAMAFAKYIWGSQVIPNGHSPQWEIVQLSDFNVKLALDKGKEKAYGA